MAARVKVALVHEWLITHGGSEEITGQLCALFPEADLFTLVADPVPSLAALIGPHEIVRDVRQPVTGRRVIVSPLQRIPGATRAHRRLLPLMPWAIERFDLTGYDLVISVSHAVAKGVRTPPGVPHLNICCSPVRYAWDLEEQYLEEAGLGRAVKGLLARALLARIRTWDRRTADRPTRILAISEFIRARVHRVWGRESGVLYPPVETEFFGTEDGRLAPEEEPQQRAPVADAAAPSERLSVRLPSSVPRLYLTASRFVPYKRIPLIVEAFKHLPDRDLVVIGDGPEWAKAQAVAGPNVRLLGHLPRAELREWLHRADGFVFAAEEDFGIAPVEALAAGTPVLAYGKGGALETVGPGTGVFFDAQTPEAIAEGVGRLEAEIAAGRVTAAGCKEWAQRFGVGEFRLALLGEVERVRTWTDDG
ncbi:MAG: glycosyl transferase family 1 [Gemmatimonas sp.]|nr:glycosyl transferase family 1 [Gemmatimonas sp.]